MRLFKRKNPEWKTLSANVDKWKEELIDLAVDTNETIQDAKVLKAFLLGAWAMKIRGTKEQKHFGPWLDKVGVDLINELLNPQEDA